ncbi:hypothetical protein V8C86DRAFT_2445432 [Haematococcus lacustris]
MLPAIEWLLVATAPCPHRLGHNSLYSSKHIKTHSLYPLLPPPPATWSHSYLPHPPLRPHPFELCSLLLSGCWWLPLHPSYTSNYTVIVTWSHSCVRQPGAMPIYTSHLQPCQSTHHKL